MNNSNKLYNHNYNCYIKGPTGPTGPTGSQGIQGIEGPTGPTGPSGAISSAFGSLMTDLTFPIEIDSTTPVTIPLSIQSSVSNNVDYTTENSIRIIEPGIYRVDFVAAGTADPGQAVTTSLVINGVEKEESKQTLISTETTITFVMVNYYSLAAGDVLELQMIGYAPGSFFFSPVESGAILSVMRVS